MNTITDTYILDLLNGKKQPSIDILIEYCLEQGKDIEDINKFIQILMNMPIVLNECINYVIQYYQDKYNIILIYDKDNNFINAYINN